MAKVSVKVKIEEREEPPIVTGEKLSFSKKTKEKLKNILKRYPKGRERSATIPALKLAQDEFGGWLCKEAMDLVANELNLAPMRVYEIATFYTMFNLTPVGKYHLQVCTNCSCMIRGSLEILETLKKETGISKNGGMSEDGMFTLTEVECLGACVEAPMMQVNNGYHTKLTKEGVISLISDLRAGKKVETATPTKAMKDSY